MVDPRLMLGGAKSPEINLTNLSRKCELIEGWLMRTYADSICSMILAYLRFCLYFGRTPVKAEPSTFVWNAVGTFIQELQISSNI